MKKNKKQEQIARLRDKALALLRNGKYGAALESITTLEELEPEQPDWPRRAAECHRGLDDRSGQIEALGRAAERYLAQHAVAKAIAMSRMVLNLDPRHAPTQKRLLELQGSPVALDAPPQAPVQTAPEPPRRRLVAPPPPENAEPAPAPKADAPPRPSLEQVLRQRRAASPRRAPAEVLPEPPAREREPIAVPFPEPEPIEVAEAEPIVVSVPEPEPIEVAEAEPIVVSVPEPIALALPESIPELIPVLEPEPEPVAVFAPEPIPALTDNLEPEPEIVPDELEISSMRAPKPSVPAPLPDGLTATSHTPIPPSDEAVTLRPPPSAAARKATEPAA